MLPSPDFGGGVAGNGNKRGASFVLQRPERAGDRMLGHGSVDIAHADGERGAQAILDGASLTLNGVGDSAQQPAETVVLRRRRGGCTPRLPIEPGAATFDPLPAQAA